MFWEYKIDIFFCIMDASALSISQKIKIKKNKKQK